jgi:hypothetical protein
MMAKQASKDMTAQVEQLARANERLKAENSQLKTELREHPSPFAKGWRMLVISLCVLLATITLIAGNMLFWAGDTLVNNERYTKTVTPLLQDKVIQQAVADYTTAQLFKNVDVGQFIEEALPPRAGFLAAPLTTQLQNGTEKVLQNILASEKFQTIWANSNEQAHRQFIQSLKSSKGNGVIDLQLVYDQLSQNLSGTKLSFLASKQLPSNIGEVEVVNASWVPTARNVVNNIGWIKPIALIIIAAASALAIWLSHNRRKLVIILGSLFAGGMFASLVGFRITQSIVVARAEPAYQTAVEHVTQIITQLLITQTITLLLISLIIVLVAWLTGPYRSATLCRERVNLILSGKLHQALFSHGEWTITLWMGRYKRLTQWVTVAVIGIIMLLVRLTPKAVVIYGVIALLLVLAIETLAAPAKQFKR